MRLPKNTEKKTRKWLGPRERQHGGLRQRKRSQLKRHSWREEVTEEKAVS